MKDYVAPDISSDGFNCPRCGAFAHQVWFRTVYGRHPMGHQTAFDPVSISKCQRCQIESVWYGGQLVFPDTSPAPQPAEDMPDDVKADYVEAASVLTRSPRGAAALLRLALQKLMPHLGEKGKKLDDDIAALVRKGLRPDIQRALDTLRVIGNNAVHPGQIDLNDQLETANALFKLLNIVVEQMIRQPKELDSLYASLPESSREAIAKRDGK